MRLGLMYPSVLCHTTPVQADEGHYNQPPVVRNLVAPEYVSITAMFSGYRGCPVYWEIDVLKLA